MRKKDLVYLLSHDCHLFCLTIVTWYWRIVVKFYNNALDQNPPTMSEVRDTPITNNLGGTNSPTQ